MNHPLFISLPKGEDELSTWKVHKSRPTRSKPDKMDDYNKKERKGEAEKARKNINQKYIQLHAKIVHGNARHQQDF